MDVGVIFVDGQGQKGVKTTEFDRIEKKRCQMCAEGLVGPELEGFEFFEAVAHHLEKGA